MEMAGCQVCLDLLEMPVIVYQNKVKVPIILHSTTELKVIKKELNGVTHLV